MSSLDYAMTQRFGEEGATVLVCSNEQSCLDYAMAQHRGEEGATILVCSNEQDKIDEAVKKLKKLGIEASGFYGDVFQEERITKI